MKLSRRTFLLPFSEQLIKQEKFTRFSEVYGQLQTLWLGIVAVCYVPSAWQVVTNDHSSLLTRFLKKCPKLCAWLLARFEAILFSVELFVRVSYYHSHLIDETRFIDRICSESKIKAFNFF